MFGQSWTNIGIGFIIAFVLGFWAVFNIVQNDRTQPFWKAAWCAAVLLIPYLGFIAWLLFGPRATKTSVL
jgi:undecaprenyl pyrophosphate phosphatase UppP